jgi:hypothetical protein
MDLLGDDGNFLARDLKRVLAAFGAMIAIWTRNFTAPDKVAKMRMWSLYVTRGEPRHLHASRWPYRKIAKVTFYAVRLGIFDGSSTS